MADDQLAAGETARLLVDVQGADAVVGTAAALAQLGDVHTAAADGAVGRDAAHAGHAVRDGLVRAGGHGLTPWARRRPRRTGRHRRRRLRQLRQLRLRRDPLRRVGALAECAAHAEAFNARVLGTGLLETVLLRAACLEFLHRFVETGDVLVQVQAANRALRTLLCVTFCFDASAFFLEGVAFGNIHNYAG